ncbi:MAG: hypothetical protein ABEK02_05240 [Haloquadratum sp.]
MTRRTDSAAAGLWGVIRGPRSGGAVGRDTAPADRALSPVVGKTLELGVGVLFVALLTATLFGGVAPAYHAAVGAELGDRTLAAAATRIDAALPPTGGRDLRLEREVAVRLPPEIRGEPYRIVATQSDAGATLALRHPNGAVDGRIRLALPDGASIRGSWTSTSPSRVRVRARAVEGGTRVTVALVDGDRSPDSARTRATEPARTLVSEVPS